MIIELRKYKIEVLRRGYDIMSNKGLSPISVMERDGNGDLIAFAE